MMLPVLCGRTHVMPSLANTHQQNPFRLQLSARNGPRPLNGFISTHHTTPAICRRGGPALCVFRGCGVHCLISDPGQYRKTTPLVLQYPDLYRMLSCVHFDTELDTKLGCATQSQPDG